MTNISDLIEGFILESIGKDFSLDFSRNELAEYFKCAPSQINYVLNTRFDYGRGFIIESQRGGGGFVRITRININADEFIHNMIKNIEDELSNMKLLLYLNSLEEYKYITQNENKIIRTALNSKSLSSPIKIEDRIRANAFKNILINLMKGVSDCEV